MEIRENGIFIKADIIPIGNDILIAIYGGDKPHIGSCMLNEKSLTLLRHKDDIALKIIYDTLSKYTKKNICLVGGIHIENITKEGIQNVLNLCKNLALKISQSKEINDPNQLGH